ncbi:MAG: type II secretion system protein GspE [Planctomycetota bacterium]|nr:MAG: type II secretion system protein GspE [Planctomycetota bacterium]
MIKKETSILQYFIDNGVLNDSNKDDVARDVYEEGKSWEEVLIEKTKEPEEVILKLIAKSCDLEFKEELKEYSVPVEFSELVSVSLARRRKIIGIGIDENVMRVATYRPFDFQSIDEISNIIGYDVEPVVASQKEVENLISRAYQKADGEFDSVMDDFSSDTLSNVLKEIEETEDLTDIANKPPIVKLVNSVIAKALKERASDIHFHPTENGMRIRIRVDGQLEDIQDIPSAIKDAVISRIKVRGKMNIAERRSPQDGRSTIKYADREIDLRISVVPTIFGERAVLRILDKSTALMSIEDLGFSENQRPTIENLINSSYGILLVTGPTGSGKTTSLYSFLSKIDAEKLNIMTIEDPIEYQLKGISQVQVEPKKDLTFSTGLKTFVRQDPDIIMVGEIRDLDTANIAIQSSLTGHMVFSTLHTNDASGAVARLLDLGVEPYLICSSVVGVIAQRLIRLLCPHCKEAYEPLEKELENLGLDKETIKDNPIYRAKGCEKCSHRGFTGRSVISETLVMNDTIREMIIRKESASAIKKVALKKGLISLRSDGIYKVIKGLTTIEEILQITHSDYGQS